MFFEDVPNDVKKYFFSQSDIEIKTSCLIVGEKQAKNTHNFRFPWPLKEQGKLAY